MGRILLVQILELMREGARAKNETDGFLSLSADPIALKSCIRPHFPKLSFETFEPCLRTRQGVDALFKSPALCLVFIA